MNSVQKKELAATLAPYFISLSHGIEHHGSQILGRVGDAAREAFYTLQGVWRGLNHPPAEAPLPPFVGGAAVHVQAMAMGAMADILARFDNGEL